MIKFGPAGNSDSFYEMGYKTTMDAPAYLKRMGLDCYEYQCGRGVKISRKAAEEFGSLAKREGIALSLHAPYYISLSSESDETREKSIGYILESARAADWMGATRVVVHSGSTAKMPRETAMILAKMTMAAAMEQLRAEGLSHIIICPETMGKVNQLGTLREVLDLCECAENMLPCVDFGHLYARTFGRLQGEAAYAAVLDEMEERLGKARASVFHAHFSRIEFTAKGGEKRHLTFRDTEFGPDFEPLGRILSDRGYTPTIICESAGTQAEDARFMKRFTETYREEAKT